MARDYFDESKNKKKVTKKKTEDKKPQSSSVTKPKATTTKVDKVASKSTFLGGGAPVQKVEKAVSKPKTTTKPKTVTQEERINQKSYGTTKPNVTQRTKRDTKPVTSKTQRQINAEDNMNLKQRKIRDTAPVQSRREIAQAMKSGDYDRASQLRGEAKPGSRRARYEQLDRNISNRVANAIKNPAPNDRDLNLKQTAAEASRRRAKTALNKVDDAARNLTDRANRWERENLSARNPMLETQRTVKNQKIGESAADRLQERYGKQELSEKQKAFSDYTSGVIQRKALGYAKTASDLLKTNEGYKAQGRWAQEDPEFARRISSHEFAKRADKAFNDYSVKQEEVQKRLSKIEDNASGAGKIALQAYGSGLEMGVDRLAGPLWAASMFASAYGNQRGQALKEGASDEQDARAAFLGAGVEVATEYMFKPVAGIASKFGGKHSLDFAGKLAAKVTSKLTGNKARLADIAIRTLGSQVEEGLEEVAGWAVNPYIQNAAYKNDLQKQKTAEAHADYEDMQRSFWNQFDTEEEAQQAALYVNSKEFIDDQVKTYKESGATDKEARSMARILQKYFLAHFDNDEEAAEEAEAEMDRFVVGDIREKHDWKELGQTLASTFLLTGVTGGASVYYTNQIGNQMLQGEVGKDRVKQYTDIVIKYDPDNAKDAKYVKDTIDRGGTPTGTQVYQVASQATEVLQDMGKREMASNQVKQRRMREEDLRVPPVAMTARGPQFNEETAKAYQASYDKALGVVRGVRKHGTDVGLSEEALTSPETMRTAAHAVAAYETGTITAEQINDLTIDNPEVRTIFELATGVDLAQYNVMKRGKIDEIASNNAMMNGLLANAADNYVQMARAEQKQWSNRTRGRMLNAMSNSFGEKGNLAMHDVLKAVDPRDQQKYLLTARIAQNVYDYARRTDISWDKMKNAYKGSFRNVDIDVMKDVYDAAKMDKDKAETAYLGRQVVAGEAMRFEKSDNGVARVTGEFTNDSARELTGEEDEAMRAVADRLGVNIRIVPDSEMTIDGRMSAGENAENVPRFNGSYDSGTNTILLAETNGLNDNILYAMSHEATHLLKQYAPDAYMKLSNYVMDRFYKSAPGRYEAAIKSKQNLYKRAVNQDLSEEAALEEIIADATRDFWSDPEFVNQISNDIEDPGFFKSIVNAIRDMLRHIRNLLSSGHFDGTEHEDVLWDMLGTYSKAEKLWLDAYRQAARNRAQMAIDELHNEVIEESSTTGAVLFDDADIDDLDMTNKTVEDKDGNPVAKFQDNGDVSFSISSYENEGRQIYKDYLDKLVNDKELSQEEANQMLNELETIYNISKRFADSGRFEPYTAWSYADVVTDAKGRPVFSSIRKNSEYKMNIDFSTICKKRRTLDAVFREMIRRGMFEKLDLNKDESAAMVVNINNLIRKNQFEAACALCFVEARRYRQQQTAKTFTNMWNELVESMYSDKDKIAYFNFGRDEQVQDISDGIHTMDDSQLDLSHVRAVAEELNDKGKPKQTAEAKAARLILNNPEQRKLMRVGDMMASTGFENMQVENPELMKVYNSKKGTGGAKSSFGDVQYLNEIINSKTFDRQKAYDVSGVRIQSFSDYVPRMVFDYVQVIADLAAKKLPAHAYTKEVLFVLQFGLTGAKVNMSLVPDVVADGIAPGLDKDGNYAWNEEGTFPWEDFTDEKGRKWPGARSIQKANGYKQNCGTIAVGISDRQIMKMLADPEIQMVIPYHKSSLNPIVAAMTNVDRFTNYEDFQNTKNAEGKTVKTDFAWDKKLFGLTHYTRGEKKGELKPKDKWGNVQDLVKEYVDWCESKNYTPKFSQFLYLKENNDPDGDFVLDENGNKIINPGYYKMLEDFALMDNDGNFKPQGDVRMQFPTAETGIDGMSMESLIERGLTDDTELEAMRAEKIGGIVDEIDNMFNEGTLTEQSVASQKLAQKFSISPEMDEAYMDAVNNDDMDEAQRLVDEAAKENGYVESVYHGTGEYFNIFKMGREGIHLGNIDQAKQVSKNRYHDRSKTTRYTYDEVLNNYEKLDHDAKLKLAAAADRAKWHHTSLVFRDSLPDFDTKNFTDDELKKYVKAVSDEYNKNNVYPLGFELPTFDRKVGENLMHLYAKISNPFVIENDLLDWTPSYIAEVLLQRAEGKTNMDGRFEMYGGGFDMDISGSEFNPDDMSRMDLQRLSGGLVKGDQAWRLLEEVLYWNGGYDGIKYLNKYEGDKNSYSYIALKPNDVKSADPVTYAEDGSVIPLSERFDPTNNDIRYSLPTQDSDGEILTDGQMNYFKNSQARDALGRLVPVYHTTNYGGFTIFDPSYSDDKRSLFFASNWDVSQTYGYGANEQITFKDIPQFSHVASIADLQNVFGDVEKYFDIKVKTRFGKDDKPIPFNEWAEISAKNGLVGGLYIEYKIPDVSETKVYKSTTLGEFLYEINTGYANIAKGHGQRGYYSCYLNLVNPLIVNAKGANWNRISYDPYGNETAGITVQDAIEQIESADIADYGIKNIDVEFEYNDDGFPIAVSYDIGLLGIPDEEHWEWTNYVESDSFEPNVEEYTDNGVLDNAELGIAMWTWVEDKLRNYVSDGMIDMMEQTNIDVNGELHYESFNKTGYDFIRGGNIVDVSEFTDNIDEVSGKEYTVNTRDLAEIAENYGHDGVIIRNLMDIGGASSLKGGKALSDIYIAFSSNQVKDVNNENPTKNPDIRYSITTRDEVSGYLMQNAENITDIPLQDARLEENRIRYSLDATNFENSIIASWDRRKRNLAEEVQETPLKNELIRLMKQVRKGSGTDRKYSTETIEETIRSIKKMYYFAKGDKAKEYAREAWDAAERIVDDIDYNDELYKQYQGITEYFASYRINLSEDIYDAFGNYKNDEVKEDFEKFIKDNSGKIRFSWERFSDRADDIELHYAYGELSEKYPDLFPSDIDNPIDMLLQMDYVLNLTDPYRDAYTSEEHSKLVEDIANSLCNIVDEGNEYKATVDDLNVKAMKQRHREAILKVKEIEKQKRDNQIRRAELWKARYNERIKQDKADKEAGKQKQNEKKLVGDIEKNIKWLSDRLRPETRSKDNAIPEQFRSALAGLLAEFDLQSKGSKKIEKKKGYPSKTTLKLKQLRDQYAAIAQENDDDGNNVFRYNGDLLVKMDELIKAMEGLDKFFDKRYGREVTIADLSLSEMFIIDTMLKSLVHQFREYKNVTIESKRAEIAGISSEVIGDMDTQVNRHGAAREGGALGKVNGLLNMAEVTPIYFFKRLGAMYKMYRELRRGFDKYIENDREVIKRLSKIMSGYYNKKNPGTTIESWRTMEDAQTFNFEYGSVTLSVAQMMEVYLYANRPQAFGHMIGDGIIVTPISPGGKIATAKEKLLGHEPMVDPVRLTYENVQEIISKLSEEQVNMANKLQELVAGYMSDLGNETTMKLYGYKMFDDPNYFGIHVSQTATNSSVDAPAITETIKNFGWTKPLTPGAKNTIVIGDIFTDVARYCNEMNQFNAYAVPVSDFMRVYNYKLRDEDGTLKGSAKSAIIKAFGNQAHTYIMNFLRDLNGASMRRNGGLEGMIDSALGKAKKAAVFMNMRVALQQPTAIVRALAQINARYFIGVRPSRKATQEMIEHCPIAQWKAWGFYDTHFGRDVEDLIMNNWSKADVIGSALYGALDNMTWGMIWQAVKKEVEAKQPALDKGSPAYWEACNRRASEVFDSTQVVDSPFHRSDAMRSKDTLVKQFTSFQAEPTLSFNVVRDFVVQAYDAVADGDKSKAAKLIAKGVEIWTLQAAVVAVAQSLWDAVRHKDPDGDDDEDEGFLELWWQNFMADFVDDLKFYNNIYFLKEFTPYAEKLVDYMKTGKWDTYDSNKLLMFQGAEKMTQGMQQFIKKIQKGDEYKHKNGEPYTWYEVMTNFLGGMGYLTGMPIGTVMRDAQSILKWFHINVFAADGTEEKTKPGLMDAIANKMGYEKAGSSDTKSEGSTYSQTADDLPDNLTDEQKQEILKAGEKRAKKNAEKGTSNGEKVDYDELTYKAMKAAAGLEGEEYDKKVYSVIANGLKDYAQNANYYELSKMRDAIEAAGGDVNYFDQQVVKNSKTAFKKSIKSDMTPDEVNQQALLYHYLVTHGVSQEEISSEIVYKSELAKDMKVAFRIGDEDTINEALEPLAQAGILQEDLDRLWTNRNRIDLTKYKENGGRYADRLKSMGTFIWPTDGVITSHFGYRNAPTAGASSNHPAIDIGAPQGTAVVAADGGVVISAGANGGYGNSVGIKHDNGMITWYNHLYSWNVKEGDTVAQGQQIAQVGSTGISTGPHLDFKIMDTNGNPVDPEKYLEAR